MGFGADFANPDDEILTSMGLFEMCFLSDPFGDSVQLQYMLSFFHFLGVWKSFQILGCLELLITD